MALEQKKPAADDKSKCYGQRWEIMQEKRTVKFFSTEKDKA